MGGRAAGMTMAGALLLGFVGCLAVVSASAGTLPLTGWPVIAAPVLLVFGVVLLCVAARRPQRRSGVCPIERELWRIIEEETRPHRRYNGAC